MDFRIVNTNCPNETLNVFILEDKYALENEFQLKSIKISRKLKKRTSANFRFVYIIMHTSWISCTRTAELNCVQHQSYNNVSEGIDKYHFHASIEEFKFNINKIHSLSYGIISEWISWYYYSMSGWWAKGGVGLFLNFRICDDIGVFIPRIFESSFVEIIWQSEEKNTQISWCHT